MGLYLLEKSVCNSSHLFDVGVVCSMEAKWSDVHLEISYHLVSFYLPFLPYTDSVSLFNHAHQIRSNMYLPPMRDCLQKKMYATSEICTDSKILRISAMLTPALYANCSPLRCLQQTRRKVPNPTLGIQPTHRDLTDPACG